MVLVGDACSAGSPLTGPGASLALAGAYVLSEQLRRTSSVERALDFYERLWSPTVEEKQESARGLRLDAVAVVLTALDSPRRAALHLAPADQPIR